TTGLVNIARPPVWSACIGWVFMATGIAITATAQGAMGVSWRIGIDRDPTELVTRGPFGWVRNPIYAGMISVVAAVAFLLPSPLSAFIAVESACLVAIQARLEEAHLARLHGDRYLAYARRVGRFVPALGRLD